MPIYKVRVESQLVSRTGRPWVNSFEVNRDVLIAEKNAVLAEATAIAEAFSANLLSSAEVTQVTFNQMLALAGSPPVTHAPPLGEPFIFTYDSMVGGRVSADEREGLDRTLLVFKDRSQGEPGRLELRHHLTDEDVQYASGLAPAFTSGQGAATALAVRTSFQALLATLVDNQMPMVMARYPVISSELQIVTGPRGGQRAKRVYTYDPTQFIISSVNDVVIGGIGTRDVGEGL